MLVPTFLHARRKTRRDSLLLLCALMLGLTACQRWRGAGEPEPPDFVQVTAVGQAGEAGEPSWVEALNRPFAARAALAHDSTVEIEAARKLMARAGARRLALRRLATELLATTSTANQKLGDFLHDQPDRLAQFDALLETQAQIDLTDETTATQAQASIGGPVVLRELKLGPGAGRDLTPEQIEALHRQAQERALEQAKTQLKAELLKTELRNGQPAETFFNGNPSAMRELEALIFIAQADEVTYPDPASAQVKLFFDRNLVREVARRSGGFISRLVGR